VLELLLRLAVDAALGVVVVALGLALQVLEELADLGAPLRLVQKAYCSSKKALAAGGKVATMRAVSAVDRAGSGSTPLRCRWKPCDVDALAAVAASADPSVPAPPGPPAAAADGACLSPSSLALDSLTRIQMSWCATSMEVCDVEKRKSPRRPVVSWRSAWTSCGK
jgi:hypothetical protein